ncbi:hypothetical protein HDF18_19050 [Mucilaginibacter sp. X5P1]|uniref:hypothetical protein n=1 Tax=Mucilaginibacter sp. X5P1 TaxID=2723088 RepID=UPI00161FEA83|nr:hypothetical protein [Mucilaginibacter sp. X5P1]MBB6139747.1 hypothetical protein [Mucilaginibacter sp. X5P1]
MSKKDVYINTVLFLISVLLLGLLIYWQIVDEFLIITETVAVSLLSISFIFKRYGLKKIQYVLFVLLIILLFNLIDFSYTAHNGDTSTTYFTSKTVVFGIKPTVFLIILCFILVNNKQFSHSIKNILYGSSIEQNEKFDKGISFYYEKFNSYSDNDLKDIYNLYKDYPKEAQAALMKIKEERSLIIEL